MTYVWVYNSAKGRMELYETGGPGGPRIVEVHAAPGADMSDLPAGVRVTPFGDEVLPFVTAAVAGDPQAQQAMFAARDALNTRSEQAGLPMLIPSGQRPVRDLPADINAQTRLTGAVLDSRQAQDRLDQDEHALRAEMAQFGVPAADIFGQYRMAQPPAGGEGSRSSFPGRMPPEYVDAYGAQDAQAARGAQLARAEYLQQVANAWSERKGGIDRLQKMQDARVAQGRLQREYNADEQRANADPGQDKNLLPGADGQWVHRQNAGAAAALRDQQDAIDAMQAAWYPQERQAQLREEMRARVRAGGRIDPSWGIDADGRDLPRYAAGGQPRFRWVYGNEFGPTILGADSGLRWRSEGEAEGAGFLPGGQVPLAQLLAQGVDPLGPALPRYADGGGYDMSGGGGFSYGQPPPNYSEVPGVSGDALIHAGYQASVRNTLEQTDVTAQLTRIQQEQQQQEQQLDAAHQQRMAQLQQHTQQQLAQLQQQLQFDLTSGTDGAPSGGLAYQAHQQRMAQLQQHTQQQLAQLQQQLQFETGNIGQQYVPILAGVRQQMELAQQRQRQQQESYAQQRGYLTGQLRQRPIAAPPSGGTTWAG